MCPRVGRDPRGRCWRPCHGPCDAKRQRLGTRLRQPPSVHLGVHNPRTPRPSSDTGKGNELAESCVRCPFPGALRSPDTLSHAGSTRAPGTVIRLESTASSSTKVIVAVSSRISRFLDPALALRRAPCDRIPDRVRADVWHLGSAWHAQGTRDYCRISWIFRIFRTLSRDSQDRLPVSAS